MSETLRHYDRWAAGYDAHDNPMVAATGWALDRDPLDCAGAAVVELGCGTGRHAGRVLDAGAVAYVGVDGSPGMLAIARGRCADPRARFVEADLAAPLPLAAGSFDLALIVLVIEHVSALDALLAEVARLLRPGGRLRLVELHPERIAAGTVAHFRDAAGEVSFASVAHPVPALVAALGRAGLRVAALREHRAEGELVAVVPRLGKHAGRPVVLDLEAHSG
jgi:SAM-dependent methyltransferase